MTPTLFSTVLVANRGEIAVRVIRTLKAMGIGSVAVYSDADADARHVAEADTAVRIGPPPARQSYLDIDSRISHLPRAYRGGAHMRKMPKVVSGIGMFNAAEMPSARTVRVSAGGMIPSSHSRAVE